MSNIATRALSGLVFVIILVSAILYNEYTLKGLFLIISTLGLYEFYKIHGISKSRIASVLVGSILYLVFSNIISIIHIDRLLLAVVSLGVATAVSILIELFDKEGSFTKAALRISGIIYITIPFSLTSYFDMDPKVNAYILLGVFIMIWSNDTGAYLSGRAFGKNKLFPRISPNKTIEGLIGGGIVAVIASIILSYSLPNILNLGSWIGIAVLVFVFANLGDLVESMMKRNLGIKDSGNIMPGHGGILDRFDGVLLTIPMVLLWLLVSNHF